MNDRQGAASLFIPNCRRIIAITLTSMWVWSLRTSEMFLARRMEPEWNDFDVALYGAICALTGLGISYGYLSLAFRRSRPSVFVLALSTAAWCLCALDAFSRGPGSLIMAIAGAVLILEGVYRRVSLESRSHSTR